MNEMASQVLAARMNQNIANDKIVLIGFMGSGKSHVGQLLAAQLQWPWRDLDALIENSIETSIADYFALHGEAAFRGLETELLQAALQNDGVLSTGGGVVTQSENRQLLRNACATVVYLRATPQTLAQRIRSQSGTRPLIDGQGALNLQQTTQRVQELLRNRAQWYEESADIVIDGDNTSAREVAREIVAQISRSKV